jgi:hypothetical protein
MVVTAATTKAAARSLEVASFVATHGAGEEGGGRDNQHYVGGGRGATKGRVDGRWRGDDDVRVLALARCCRRRGEDVTINIGGRWEVGGGRGARDKGGSRGGGCERGEPLPPSAAAVTVVVAAITIPTVALV